MQHLLENIEAYEFQDLTVFHPLILSWVPSMQQKFFTKEQNAGTGTMLWPSSRTNAPDEYIGPSIS